MVLTVLLLNTPSLLGFALLTEFDRLLASLFPSLGVAVPFGVRGLLAAGDCVGVCLLLYLAVGCFTSGLRPGGRFEEGILRFFVSCMSWAMDLPSSCSCFCVFALAMARS